MKKLSLTFDNGPTPGITDRVLDVLDEFDVKAGFYLVGSKLDQPDGRQLAERAIASGHVIGNHTFTHGPPLGLQTTAGVATDEILRAHRNLGDLAGTTPLFRPNGRGVIGSHLLSAEAVTVLTELGATVVLWNSVPRDRKAVVDRPDLWIDDARAAIDDNDWTLMILHDRPSGFDDPGPMAFLPDFLRWARDNVELRLDYPSACVPMSAGRAHPSLAAYVTANNAGAA